MKRKGYSRSINKLIETVGDVAEFQTLADWYEYFEKDRRLKMGENAYLSPHNKYYRK